MFVACFDPGGALARADPARPGGFRAYLYGVARNVARHFEARRARAAARAAAEPPDLDRLPADEASLSREFDRAWAQAIFREAARRQAELARERGPDAERRVELLRLRFQEGLPIRDIARRWGDDAARLHHEYARARQELKAALREVVAFHQPGPPEAVEQACSDLLSLLG